MNILVEQLPTAVSIDSVDYEINTDFHACIRVILAFEDDELTGYEKQLIMLQNLYPKIPDNVGTALELALKFLNGGRAREDQDTPSLRLYSFSQDADFIFAAFQQTHGIDLETAELHWWKFLALFADLGADTTFCSLASLRSRLKTGKATDEEKKMAREMENIISLPEPDMRTTEEREQEAEFDRLVKEGAHV